RDHRRRDGRTRRMRDAQQRPLRARRRKRSRRRARPNGIPPGEENIAPARSAFLVTWKEAAMNPQETERQTTKLLLTLRRELEQRITNEEIMTVGRAHYAKLSRQATITDYIPLLVYRQTKEQLTLAEGRSDRRQQPASVGTQRAPERRPGNPRRQHWPLRLTRGPVARASKSRTA